MIEVRLESPPDTALDAVQLGQVLYFRIHKSDPAVETRAFVQHRPVLYTRPLCDWTAEPVLGFFPESPGSYRLAVDWRLPGSDATGRVDLSVSVRGDAQGAPVRQNLLPGVSMWAPSRWEANLLRDSEHEMLHMLRSLVKPGMTAYDIGANIGIYSRPMAEGLGSGGKLYCIEANPVCVQFLRTNLLAGGADNATIVPVALLDRNGSTRFVVNYGNANLGVSERSGFFPDKIGHEIEVPSYTFDDLVHTFGLAPPDLIKLDVEGAEHLVVRGMRQSLQVHRPILVMEVHGEPCAERTFEVLDAFSYSYLDPAENREMTRGEEVMRHFGDRVFQVVARPAEER